MALVTITRSPSNSNSISSNESGSVKEEENKKTCKSLNECYFAGKCTVLMLSSNDERLQRQPVGDGSRFCQISTELSSSQTSIGSVGSDIQQHLQSMFYLLRPEETLKMAVKLESLRAGRTRYLVVVSRPAKNLTPSLAKFTPSSTNINIQNTQQQPGNISTQRSYSRQQSKEHHQQKQSQEQQSSGMTAAGSGMGSNSNMSTTETITSHSNTENIYHRCSINQNNNSNSNCSILFNTNNELSSAPSGGIAGSRSSANLTCDIQQLQQQQQQQFTDNNLRRYQAATVLADRDENLIMGDTESNFSGSSGKSSSNEIEESCLLGIDCNEKTTVGLVLKVMADTSIRLDGDGGFSVNVCGRQHIFKPVSVQAMWSALQTLYKISSKAQEHNFFAGGSSHDWVQYYEDRIESDRSCLNEWHAMDSIESRRPPSPDTIRNKPTERDETERVIRTALKEIMMSVDLDEVTSKYIRVRLEEHLDMDLGEFKSFIDEEMLVILGQMDAPTEIFDHVYLGSEWNASNLEELQRNGVHHILNVTREIDNFFPGMFDYFNVRVYDDEKTDLLKHWDNTFKYITRAKADGSKVLVHCKMGISRSASVVIAYAMKAYNWNFEQAITHVKKKRSCIKPNKSFLSQLETYQGMLDAMKNKEKLQRSKSETNLKSENVKDGRMLPGSEPTPLIQALQNNRNSTYPSSKKEAYYKRIHQRPNSSPDIPKATSDVVSLIKPLSVSLETLVSDPSDVRLQPEVNCETTNLRWQNYSISQNQIIYLENESTNSSLTSQQLETISSDDRGNCCTETTTNLPFVKNMISELELNEKKTKDDEQQYHLRKTDSWDPGENRMKGGSNCMVAGEEKQVYNCSAEIIHQDSFDNPKTFTSIQLSKISPAKKEGDAFSKQVNQVFDCEEKRQNQITDPFVSRQSSWSSVDSACILGDHLPSRNSSWGSGDNRIIPSRNSSWGSYDTKFQQSTSLPLTEDVVMGQSGIFPYSQDEIPWHFGTVKRTKQKIEEKHTPAVPLNVIQKSSSTPVTHYSSVSTTTTTSIDAKNNNNKILCDIKKSLLIDNLTNRTSIKGSLLHHHHHHHQQQRQEQAKIIYNTHSRCKSEEMLTVQKGISLLPTSESCETVDPRSSSPDFNDNNINTSILSTSVPETFSISFLNNNSSNNNSSSSDETSTMTTSLKLQQRRQQFRKSSVSTDEPADKKINKNRDNQLQSIGKVRNLKMNFEAKANNQQIVGGVQKRLEEEKKGHSLPSSPIAIHIDVSSTGGGGGGGFPNSIIEGVSSDDINVRGLVDKYEVTKMRTSARQPRPKSLFETKFNLKSFQHKQNQPLMMSHSTIFATQKSMEENRKPPPMPPNQQPIVKSILLNTNQNLAINNGKGIGCRKQQLQHGKTHPLTKLGGIGKRLNATTAAAYNTM